MKKIFSYLLYVLAFLLVILSLKIDFNIAAKETVIFVILACLFIYFGGLLLFKDSNNKKIFKINLWIYFIIYLLLFIDLTLFDSSWGRQGLIFIKFDFTNINTMINLIPFKTVYEYLVSNFNNLTETSTIVYNVVGNLVALMPMSFFLPKLFKKQNNFWVFFLTNFIIVLVIELLQLFCIVGRFDIDDIILNVSGALIMFKVLKIDTLDNLIQNIFFLEHNKIDKKKLLKLSIIFLLIVCIIFGIMKYHNHLYKNNLSNIHYDMKIVSEDNNCLNNLDKFYEDDLYTYYFKCASSDKVYAIINDKDKYLVKDLLNNIQDTYNVDIYKIEERLDFYNIDYIKEAKYTYINLDVTVPIVDNSYSSPDIDIKIDNKDIINYKLDYERAIFNDNNYNIDIHLIPLHKGNTNITITCIDSNTKKILKENKYAIIVTNDLKVSYEM